MKRMVKLALAAIVALTGITATAADYIDFNDAAYEAYVDKGGIPKTESVLLAPNRKLSTVTVVSGDLFLGHGNRAVGKWYPCTGPLAAGTNKPGVHYYVYTKTATEEYAVCQFQGKEAGYTYLMVVDVKFTQVGNDIYAQVIKTHYPYNDPYGMDQSATATSGNYEPNLATWFQKVSTKTGGVIMSLHNVGFEFADPDLKCTVTYQDENGTTIGAEQVPYGDAATQQPTAPAKAGYVAAGWTDPLTSVRNDITVRPVYHKLCTVRFFYPDGTQIGNDQTVEETKSATPPDMTGVTYNGTPFYGWIGNYTVVSDDTDFYGDFHYVPQWTTGEYVHADWTPATGNLLPSATMTASITYHTENNRSPGNNAWALCNREIPVNKSTYTDVVGVRKGSVEWQFTTDKVYINAINVFTSWGDGGRDGIAIAQILYKTNSVSDWIEVAGPRDNNAVSYSINAGSTGGARFATIANADNSFFIKDATELKLVFSDAQDNNGSGYVEIEAVGQTATELAGGAYVTFVDWDDSVIQSNKVAFHAAAVPPANPVRQGYKFVGWDKTFSDITVELTVKALYHKWCTVTFKDADGTTLDTQTVEETLAATAPSMTGRTYQDDPFLCWDGDPTVISDDVVFTAIYGVLPDYVNDVIATGTVPADTLIWAGGASGNWDTTSRKWATPAGALTTWTDGSKAVFPVSAAVTLAEPRTAASVITMYQAQNVTFSGEEIDFVAPAVARFAASSTLRFENMVGGTAGFIQMADAGVTAETDIVSNYVATGWLAVSNGTFKVVGSGKLGNGTMTAPVFLANDTVYEYASDYRQTFKGPINMTSRGGGTATTGRFVLSTNTYVIINCAAEYEERIFTRTDIYGYAYVNDGNYHDFYSNAKGIYIHDGATMSLGSGYGVYGHRNWHVNIEAGGTVIYRNKQNAGLAESDTKVLGGEIQFPYDYTANPQDNFFTKLVLQDGARLTGKIYTWAYGAYTHEVGGTSPSFIEVDKIRVGRTGDCNQWKNYTVNSGAKCLETLDVADVTGDAAADLVVSSELYANTYTTYAAADAKYFGFLKKGAGTVKFTGTSTNYNAAVTMQAGTVALGPNAKLYGTALSVEGDSFLEIAKGAELAFADSTATAWTADKVLTIKGDLPTHGIRFGTDANGLTAAQLSQIKKEDSKAAAWLNSTGYLRIGTPYTIMMFK